MKILSIFLILLIMAGSASAQWYPRSENYTTTGDVNADNGIFTGDVTVGGVVSATGGTVISGVYDGDFRLAANHSFYSTTGSGGIDWSNATGPWKMPTGQGTIGGLTDFNAAITTRNITLDANYNIVASGTGTITGAATVSGTTLTASGTVSGEQVTSTDDALVTDDLTVDGGARIDETATVNALASNTTVAAGSADGRRSILSLSLYILPSRCR